METGTYPRPGEDAFDSLDWDPDLPSAKSLDESPEPVPLKPQPVQPVAYTTVGSVVNSNIPLQLSAPNRIQREGANRRPLMSLLQGLQVPSATQKRGPAPPLNMSNSMHYAQQLSARQSNPDNQNPFPRYYRTENMAQEQDTATQVISQSSMLLSQQEKESLVTHYGAYNGIQSAAGGGSSPLKRSNVPHHTRHQAFNIKELHDDDTRSRSSAQGAVQGLEKMQTLQRLAKFENPMQQHARNRLSEFSVARMEASAANPLGELNRNYQFPSASAAGPSVPQSNPLLGARDGGYSNTQQPPSRPPGYPQPLTAGPPGQRQPPPALISALAQQTVAAQAAWEGVECYNGTHQADNSWGYEQTVELLSQQMQSVPPAALDYHDIYESVKVADTLPYTEVSKYYPHGWPSTFDGQHTAMPWDTQRRMDMVSAQNDEEKFAAASMDKKPDDWFYYGQRRMWGMTVDDHMAELQMRSAGREATLGAVAPPRRKFTESVIPKKVTPKEMNDMSVGEAAAPILNAAFATFLSLHDKGVDSASELSGFTEPKPEWIDSDPKANNTLFGEDWGRVPTVPKIQIQSRGGSRHNRRTIW